MEEKKFERKKVPMTPGYGLRDWYNIVESGKNMSGVEGEVEVNDGELKKHNKEEDAWIAINGKVYNMTEYLKFHPGGKNVLLSTAGQDGTERFSMLFFHSFSLLHLLPLPFFSLTTKEAFHSWVNYEFILSKCYVGKLVK